VVGSHPESIDNLFIRHTLKSNKSAPRLAAGILTRVRTRLQVRH